MAGHLVFFKIVCWIFSRNKIPWNHFTFIILYPAISRLRNFRGRGGAACSVQSSFMHEPTLLARGTIPPCVFWTKTATMGSPTAHTFGWRVRSMVLVLTTTVVLRVRLLSRVRRFWISAKSISSWRPYIFTTIWALKWWLRSSPAWTSTRGTWSGI